MCRAFEELCDEADVRDLWVELSVKPTPLTVKRAVNQRTAEPLRKVLWVHRQLDRVTLRKKDNKLELMSRQIHFDNFEGAVRMLLVNLRQKKEPA